MSVVLERVRRAFAGDDVYEKNIALRLAYDRMEALERDLLSAQVDEQIQMMRLENAERDVARLVADQSLLLEALTIAVRHSCDHCSEEIAKARRIAAKFEI